MSNSVEIVALVEGSTERIFLAELLVPYLAERGVYLTPIVISKPAQKGGDVKFARVRNDIELHLKQRGDTYLTLFLDYYALRSDWPGLAEAKQQMTPAEQLGVPQTEIEAILTECGEPEAIDDSPLTAPSKRLETLSGRFKKTSTGIAIARAIGLPTMRRECPLFNGWLTTVENLKGADSG